MTGTTDFAQIAVENPPSEAHRLAFDILVDRTLGYIGNYYVKLSGKIDAVVFAGGIGEKSALLRRTLCEKCESLGIAMDLEANDKGPDDNETVKDISKGSGKGPRVFICQTNEQVRFNSNHGTCKTKSNRSLFCFLSSSRWHATVLARDLEESI